MEAAVKEDTRRNKGSGALSGGQALAECGGQEGSSQRMSCQPIAARLLVGGMGKSPPGSGP
nr:PREDICTED: mitotic-spindle organizing protein 2-like [Equus przewalskii]